MGFQTNISFLNDHFDWIEKHPKEFVKAIKYEMNYGTESLVRHCLARDRAKAKGEEYYDPNYGESPEGAEARRHYVTVHQARHMDEPQVIFTHRNSAYEIRDLCRGIELGYLDTRSNPETHVGIYREIAKELRRHAKELETALNVYEAHGELCGAQEWAYDDNEKVIIYGTCDKPKGHPGRWHRELRGDHLWAEWSGSRDDRAPTEEST